MNPHEFHIVYDGPALSGNTFDVRDLAPALLAFGDMLEHANRVINKDKTQVSVRVKASFKTGCFGIDFSLVQTSIQHIVDMFTAKEVAALGTILGLLGLNGKDGLLWLIKRIKGRKIKEISASADGRATIILNDERIDVDSRIVDLLSDLELRESIEKAVKEPLDKEGIDTFAVSDGEVISFRVTESDSRYFISPKLEEVLLDSREIEMLLSPVSISFKKDNVWKFTDGAATYPIRMTDKSLLQRIDHNLPVSKGDVFRLRLGVTTSNTEHGIKTDYELLEVLEHIPASVQLNLVE